MYKQYHTSLLLLTRVTIKKLCLLLTLFFTFQFCHAMPSTDLLPPAETDTVPPQLLTVARLWQDPADKTAYTVTFFQSAKFYKLLKTNKNCKTVLALLTQSQKNNKPVKVYLTVQYGDTIANVKAVKK